MHRPQGGAVWLGSEAAEALERPSAWAPRPGPAARDRLVAQQYGCDRRQQEADQRCEENRRSNRIQPIDGTARMRVVAAFNRSLFGRSSFGPTDRTTDQTVGRDPSRVPTFEGLSAYLAFEAGDLADLRHGFGTVIDRAAFTGSMAAF